MSNYRRLISYIYSYEGGIKGKNIGFAKLEAKNGQCKISVNVKRVYVGSSDIGVYLLSGQEEIKLGNIFVRNGSGEFRTVVNVANVENTSVSMELCHGLTIHEVENAWQCYTTIWEDAVAHAAEIELAEASTEHMNQTRREDAPERVSIADQIEREIENETVHGAEFEQEKSGSGFAESVFKEYGSEEPATNGFWANEAEINEADINETGVNAAEINNVDTYGAETYAAELGGLEQNEYAQKADLVQEEQTDLDSGAIVEAQADTLPPLGDQSVLNALDHIEAEDGENRKVWNFFKTQHAKIPAFDYPHGCEVLTIKPQDIGLLPREVWVFGNNSFLLHGYYNYRYLILARLGNPQGKARFLLGVPGHYYSNEKYMASMFGFPEFVLSKKQPTEDGRFGYWYTDIRVDD